MIAALRTGATRADRKLSGYDMRTYNALARRGYVEFTVASISLRAGTTRELVTAIKITDTGRDALAEHIGTAAAAPPVLEADRNGWRPAYDYWTRQMIAAKRDADMDAWREAHAARSAVVERHSAEHREHMQNVTLIAVNAAL
ncbi:hypothetical protein ACFV2X_48115 [Streptomyces sp. NPDC059679]|uniref:hypothetical protein n=1 Tax=Streptomyces sp. NPDC059679 TaxID=3346903 RepID=UPI0036C4B59F